MPDDAVERFAAYLTMLKERSGRSFDSLALRAHASGSSLQRYCSGVVVPVDFGIVERVGKACGATRSELLELHHRWVRADLARRPGAPAGSVPGAVPAPASLPGGSGPVEPVSAPRPPAASLLRRVRRSASVPIARHVLLAAMIPVLGASLLVALVFGPGPDRRPAAPPAAAAAQADATAADVASWSGYPVPVSPRSFGVTVANDSGEMPTFAVGSVRLWDSRTRWANLEPARGVFTWTTLDRLVEGARRAGLPVVFTFGGTPGWAAPGAPRAAYDDGSRAAPPDDLADWDGFVRAVAHRYRGRIGAYELWVMGNSPKFYTGSAESLVELTRRAARQLRAADPAATVVCPSMGELWRPQARAVLTRFAALGGYDRCDVAGVKLHQQRSTDPPETMIDLVEEIAEAFHAGGAHPGIWNTGTTYDIRLQQHVPDDLAADYAMRFYLVGLYARYGRMYLYSWGGANVPVPLQVAGEDPFPAARAVEELQGWLSGARIAGCGRGQAIGLPAAVWECRFVRAASGSRVDAVIRWTTGAAVSVRAPAWARSQRRFGSPPRPLGAGEAVTVSQSPVLITAGGPGPLPGAA